MMFLAARGGDSEYWAILCKWIKAQMRFWLEINGKDLFFILGFATRNTTTQNAECSEEERKAEGSSKKHIVHLFFNF